MRLVMDTNRLIAALVRAGLTREIIHSNKIEFVIPEGAIEEIIFSQSRNLSKHNTFQRVKLFDKAENSS